MWPAALTMQLIVFLLNQKPFLWEHYRISRVNFQLGMASTFFPSPFCEDQSPVTGGGKPCCSMSQRCDSGRVLSGVTVTAAVTKVRFKMVSADILKNY